MMGFDSKTYNEALKQMWEWLDKQTGNSNGIKVEVKDNKTTVTLDDGRVGVARCNPCDKFDIVTGIRVALDDIERKSRKLSILEKQMIQTALDIGAQKIILYKYDEDTNVIVFLSDKNEAVMIIQHDEAFDWLDNEKEYVIKELIENRL